MVQQKVYKKKTTKRQQDKNGDGDGIDEKKLKENIEKMAKTKEGLITLANEGISIVNTALG